MIKKTLLRRLLRAAAGMIQGGLSETTRRCGHPACACASDPARRHGPHLYVTFQQDGKNRSLYVPAAYADQARRAHAAWQEFWETGCALAALNRQQLPKQWAGEKSKGGKRRPRG